MGQSREAAGDAGARPLVDRLVRVLSMRWTIVVIGLTFLGTAPVLFLADSSGRVTLGTVVFWAVLSLLVLAGVASAAATLSGVDPEADEIANRLVPGPDQQLLVSRWLRRTRWARNVGGAAGIIWWMIATRNEGPILVLGLGGVAIGSMAAQLHQVRLRPGFRTASLEQRSVAHYAPSSTQRQLAVVAAGAVVLAVVGAAGLVWVDDAGLAPVLWAAGALAVVAAGYGLQRRVAHRPRPALGPELRYADDVARILAIGRGLGEPAGFWSLALLAAGVRALEPVIGGFAMVLSTVLALYAFVTWWQNRRLGLTHLLDESADSADRSEPTAGPGNFHPPGEPTIEPSSVSNHRSTSEAR